MAFNAKSIAGLIRTQAAQTWKLSVAFTVLYRMQGVDKPGAAIKTIAETADEKADNKTMIDAIRGAWTYASKFYDVIMTAEEKDEILAMSTGDARDKVLDLMRHHIAALDLPEKVGRSAYFAVIQHKDAAAVKAEAARNAKAAANAEEEKAEETPPATEEVQQDTPNTAIEEPLSPVAMMLKQAEGLTDAELAELSAGMTALMIARQEIAAAAAEEARRIEAEAQKVAA